MAAFLSSLNVDERGRNIMCGVGAPLFLVYYQFTKRVIAYKKRSSQYVKKVTKLENYRAKF